MEQLCQVRVVSVIRSNIIRETAAKYSVFDGDRRVLLIYLCYHRVWVGTSCLWAGGIFG